MERKQLIAIIIIAIVVIGGLGGYFLFLGPKPEEKKAGVEIYLDGKNQTSIEWNRFAVPREKEELLYDPHNITNAGTGIIDVAFRTKVMHHNGTRWNEIYNGTHWIVNQPNVTVSLVYASNTTKGQWHILPFQKLGEQSTYWIDFTCTDQVIYLKFYYTGSDPTVDGKVVFTNLYFDGNGNNTLDGLDKAFNFSNNPDLPEKNVLKVYSPTTGSSWSSIPEEYSWNGDISPSNVPVTIAMSSDKKNITWTIPFDVIGAEKDKTIGFALQAFGYDWFPTEATSTDAAKYKKLQLDMPERKEFVVMPQQTVKFYIKAIFSPTASGNYSFKFSRAVLRFGFKAADYIEWSAKVVNENVTGTLPQENPPAPPLWVKMRVQTVAGTSANLQLTQHLSDEKGTENTLMVTVSIYGGGSGFGIFGLVLPANSEVGYSIGVSGFGTISILGETTKEYAGLSRTVLYGNITLDGTQYTNYWDKETGVLVETYSIFSANGTGPEGAYRYKAILSMVASVTSLWEAPGFPVDPNLVSIIIVIVVIIVVVAIIMRRRAAPQESPA